ncbi:MAG: hypothetical protein IT438_07995 [Phycisphaerales bacterium]|nr:hypothetical protein [Phycisphaerales bacterium]
MEHRIVRLDYALKRGGAPDGRQRIRFRMFGVNGDGIDATLEVNPFRIARMKHGDRGEHPVEQLTDWLIATPAGTITPRSFRALRTFRENPEKMRAIAAMMKVMEAV